MSDGNEGEEECEGGKGDGDVGDVDNGCRGAATGRCYLFQGT